MRHGPHGPRGLVPGQEKPRFDILSFLGDQIRTHHQEEKRLPLSEK